MNNIIIIDIDTERANSIIITKPKEFVQPTNFEDAKKMILLDVECLIETTYKLIDVAGNNDYASKKELVENAIIRLHSMIVEKPQEIPTQEEEENDTEK